VAAGIRNGAFGQVLLASVTIDGATTLYKVRVLNDLDGPVSLTVEGLPTMFAREEALTRWMLPLL
jgi:hypothetical protein